MRPTKGRGAVRNVAGRFERTTHEPFDDGWGTADETPPPLLTVVTPEASRTILCKNDSPDVPFDVSINPYKGCEHGCVYCFARPTHAYLDLSPGLDFESRIFSKPAAPDLLRAALRKPGYRPTPIAIGTNTDPYQPTERKLGLTRRILEVLWEHRHPVSIVTKSNLILRDLDLISALAGEGLTSVHLSITTLDRELARRMEPRAATPGRRLEAIETLHASGVPTGVMASPMIPGLNDAELDAIIEAAAKAGASSAAYILLRLPHEVKELFVDWLRTHYPSKERRVLNLLREMRAGRLYEAGFGKRMRGSGPLADALQRRFTLACRRNGLQPARGDLDCTRFRVPPRRGDQATLFG